MFSIIGFNHSHAGAHVFGEHEWAPACANALRGIQVPQAVQGELLP
jgi:hypothetical protein